MKKIVLEFFRKHLSRQFLWRIGRAIYREARSDVNNDLNVDGELLVQNRILENFSNLTEKLVFFDVGANIGDWTISLLEKAIERGMDKRVEVHLFEPVKSTFETLNARLETKFPEHFDKLFLVNEGFSSETGIAEMFIIAQNAGTNSLYPDPMHVTNQRLPVKLTTGTDYCAHQKINKIHLLKCDVEGHDVEVLLGIKSLIQESKVLVFQFEYNHFWVYSRHFLKDVFELINGQPYKIGKITPSAIEIYEAWHPELEKFFPGNYVVIHETALSWFPLVRGNFDEFHTYHT